MNPMAEYKEWQRSYLGYHERFVNAYTLTLPAGKEITVLQAPSPGKSGVDFREVCSLSKVYTLSCVVPTAGI